MTVDVLAEDEKRSLGDQLVAASGCSGDARHMADLLARSGRLTAFQAAQVQAGNAQHLVLGEYIILDQLGSGGMGQVFKAQHQRMKRIVALKLISPDALRDERAQKRFQREVQAAAKLLHPNIVTAFDAGWANGQYYLVMEYIAGRDLAAIVSQLGPLSVATATNYILQAARGLAFAHSKGIIHRDVKPANLLVNDGETVKILDMGLARLDEPGTADEGLTQLGQVLGTAHYMAPEQALDVRAADARSDIYSLGCTLYFLLTGENMYAAGTLTQVILAHYQQPIPDLRAKCRDVSSELDAVFCRMVAKSPADRYRTMTEVVLALVNLDVAGGSIPLPGPAPTAGVSPAAATDTAALAARDLKALVSIIPALKSEKTRVLVAKAAGATFATIIAPLVVAVMLKLYELNEPAPAPAPSPPASVAVGSTTAPPAQAPAGTEIARANLPGARGGQDQVITPPRAVAPFDAKAARAHQQAWASRYGIPFKRNNSIGMPLVLIPAGGFAMGSTPEQIEAARRIAERRADKSRDAAVTHFDQEMPKHRVGLDRAFLLGATEVTIKQFGRFVEVTDYATDGERLIRHEAVPTDPRDDGKSKLDWRHPGYATSDDAPVTQLTWSDAVHFCNWLSRRETLSPCYEEDGAHGWRLVESANGYRLPTEAEWEFACRAGTTGLFSFGNDVGQLERYGWYGKNDGRHPHEVAGKRPNPFGLFDMHGNVAEWCHDWFAADYYATSARSNPFGPPTGNIHSVRGGSWRDPQGSFCRSAFRADESSTRNSRCGFRVLRVELSRDGQ